MQLVLIEAIPLLLRAICQTIEQNPERHILIQDTSLLRLETTLLETKPDVLWLDTYFPEVRDGTLIKDLHKKFPSLRILLFGTDEILPEIRKYFKSGVHAFLPKTAALEEMEAALLALEAGIFYVPVSLNNSLTVWLTASSPKKKPAARKLTFREKEILQLIVEEFTTREIAKKLFIGLCTVETHRVNLIQKLGVKNTAGLVRVAFEAGLYGA